MEGIGILWQHLQIGWSACCYGTTTIQWLGYRVAGLGAFEVLHLWLRSNYFPQYEIFLWWNNYYICVLDKNSLCNSGNWSALQVWTISCIHQMQISLALRTLHWHLRKIITLRAKAHCFSKELHSYLYYPKAAQQLNRYSDQIKSSGYLLWSILVPSDVSLRQVTRTCLY